MLWILPGSRRQHLAEPCSNAIYKPEIGSIQLSQREQNGPLAPKAGDDQISAFVEAARAAPVPASGRGRLIFALDATMSRQPTWDLAIELQSRMFQVTAAWGGLDVQLVYFRGMNECRASNFVSGGQGLAALMSKIEVRGGKTQIRKVLSHAADEAARAKVAALVYVGDAMEENVDDLCSRAGRLVLYGVKAFMFQEGDDASTSRAYREIARLTGGAYCAFDASSANRLAQLLRAAAAYAAGGRTALEKHALENAEAQLLLKQMR